VAWIELHQSLWTHRKTLLLAAALDLDETYAGAHVARLWTWALDNAPEGDLSGLPPRVIAFGAAWKGDAAMFVEALVEVGWLERDGESLWLHDWEEYAGRLIAKRQANAERMRAARATQPPSLKESRAMNVQTTCNARTGATVPNRTGPDSTGTTANAVVVDAPRGATATAAPSLSADARFVLNEWRVAHGRTKPPRLNPTQVQALEDALADLGKDRLLESVGWSARQGVTEWPKCLRAAYSKRKAEEATASAPRPQNGYAKANGLHGPGGRQETPRAMLALQQIKRGWPLHPEDVTPDLQAEMDAILASGVPIE
jgi:hypothetical protein